MTRFALGSLACPMLAAATASVLCACGDAHTFKIRPDSWGDTQPLVDWNGTIVEMHHQMLPCDAGAPDECLRSFVGDHMEFEGLDVEGLKSDCSGDDEAAVAIDVQPRSIIFDFSNVENPGVFRRTDFDGYVIRDLTGLAPEIVVATVDRELSTLDLADHQLVVDGGTLRANFAGLAFDSTDLVKIDLAFAE